MRWKALGFACVLTACSTPSAPRPEAYVEFPLATSGPPPWTVGEALASLSPEERLAFGVGADPEAPLARHLHEPAAGRPDPGGACYGGLCATTAVSDRPAPFCCT